MVRLALDERPRARQIAIRTHAPGTSGTYHLPDLWCLHLYRYHGELALDGEPLAIRPGCAGFTAPGVVASYAWQARSTHAYAHFALAEPAAGSFLLPLMLDLGEDFEPLFRRLEEAVTHRATQPRRAEVRLWDILWELAERAPVVGESSPLHPAVREAVRRIERRLAEPLTVAALAAEVELSHNHLLRLFRAAFGLSVVGYIRRRRAEQARHLLLHSTLPIKAIAAEVGVRDLHYFNRLLRQELGASPRAVRAAGRR
ncbi:MAG: helix-turn-helix transcriptional regulator [Armatimonadetes bacterium]|nr:helix-turn-helix transcriptional regulator [Armatimonadota bacterium]